MQNSLYFYREEINHWSDRILLKEGFNCLNLLFSTNLRGVYLYSCKTKDHIFCLLEHLILRKSLEIFNLLFICTGNKIIFGTFCGTIKFTSVIFQTHFLRIICFFFISLKLLFLKFNVIFLDAKNNQKLLWYCHLYIACTANIASRCSIYTLYPSLLFGIILCLLAALSRVFCFFD